MSGPAGPTGVIVLKKIADNTYEQYGAITLSDGALTQVTTSQSILQLLTRFNYEQKMQWFEDFFSRTSQSQNNSNSKGWPSGSWGTPQGAGNTVMTRASTVSGAVTIESDSAGVLGAVWAQLDPDSGGGSGRVISNANRQPTYYFRWAQQGAPGAGTRSLGFQAVDGTDIVTSSDAIFFKHLWNQNIYGACRSGNQETLVSSGVSGDNGVYHKGKIVVGTGGVADTLVMGEYIGDGTANRTIAVTTYTPICVWVLGRNSALNAIGAFKISGMPDGQSHPWTNNPATSSSTRLNRINTLVSTGFTVQSDLNVLGDPYFYICFPSVSGYTEAGTYSGTGWSREGAVQIDTTGGNFHVSFGSQFLAADVGQTMIRVSDGAVIGTISAVTNAANATGTINISGVFPAGQWRWQPRQIRLSFIPDFGMLCSTTGLNSGDASAVQFAPGRGLSDDIASNSGTTQSFQGTSLSPGNATIQTNSQVLEVRNDNPSGVGGFNGTGHDYFYFMMKHGSPQIPLELIDYTGDGAASRTVSSGGTLQPGFFMGFGKNDTPKWKATPSTVEANDRDYAFQDGNAMIDDKVTFGAGVVNLGAGDLNTNKTLYRGYIASGASSVTSSPTAQFYIDDVLFATITTNVPTVDLKPSLTTSNASSLGMDVDYIGMIQNREAS